MVVESAAIGRASKNRIGAFTHCRASRVDQTAVSVGGGIITLS